MKSRGDKKELDSRDPYQMQSHDITRMIQRGGDLCFPIKIFKS